MFIAFGMVTVKTAYIDIHFYTVGRRIGFVIIKLTGKFIKVAF